MFSFVKDTDLDRADTEPSGDGLAEAVGADESEYDRLGEICVAERSWEGLMVLMVRVAAPESVGDSDREAESDKALDADDDSEAIDESEVLLASTDTDGERLFESERVLRVREEDGSLV